MHIIVNMIIGAVFALISVKLVTEMEKKQEREAAQIQKQQQCEKKSCK